MSGRTDWAFQILGPLEARAGGELVDPGSLKQRVLLAVLLCRANSVVSIGELMDALWGDEAPRTALKNLQVYVSQLRKVLQGGRGDLLSFRSSGYRITLGPSELDAFEFEKLAREGRLNLRAGQQRRAADLLRSALDKWRGPALAEMCAVPQLQEEATRLEGRRVSTYEDWFEAKLGLGHAAEVLGEIDELVRAHPLRERLRSQQMSALYESGRQGEALAAFDDVRQALARELGLAPTPALQRQYQALLSGTPTVETSQAPRQAVLLHPGAVTAHLAQLPRDADDFTGRGPQLDALTRALDGQDRRGLAVLHGPPGAGKTALAIHAAHRLRDNFPDGQIVVQLRAPDGRRRAPGDVLTELLRLFDVPRATVVKRQQEREALLRAWLSERRILLVLDDAPDEALVRPLLPGTGGSGVLVTSRRLLGGLESACYVDVGPFTKEEGVQLLGRVVGAERVAAEAAAAQRVVTLCGLLPLAIRIAGTKLIARPHLSLPLYADRLAAPGRRLGELSVRDLSVRSAIDAGFRDLNPDEQALLIGLGSLPEPCFTIADVEALPGSEPERAEIALDGLIDAHFVTELAADDGSHTARYSLPELFRLFAGELAPQHGAEPPATVS